MDQKKSTSWGTVAGLLVAGLVIVGFAVVTSKPFQEASHTETALNTGSGMAEEHPTEAEDEAPSKAADEKPAEAMDEKPSEVADATPSEPAKDAASEPADEPPSKVAEADAEPAEAADAAGGGGECCKPGDMTPPLELVKQVPPGGLHNPYDWQKLKAESPEDYLVKQFRLPGCNECHGGGGGGGFCPALSQGVWFWGNTDDVLFRLIVLGSKALEEQGFVRIQWGTVKAPMPEMGHVIKTSDHVWKIISFIRSINPPGTNPPEKVIPGRMKDAAAN